ncbi:T9SS type A sorting domain-containing protein [Flavobacterium sedimenticola]|uniref:T9SS type A sorting domain-containing protein n=1 Tax=Flavobacterium sedimenticola TaxID=3043286 RepID=A0ABT6XP45_9FLAO|nr:T9SS type A sorting domain-containing protein [Flavobacterium sedimenticola]MDI9256747.1 T9SS type A sorting domain-containing protein [Flavobacterium sedimenticola]
MKRKTSLFIFLATMQCFFSIVAAQTTQWAGSYGGNGEDVAVSIYTDAAGNTYTTGYFSNFCDFDITDGTSVIEHGNDFEIFVAKYNHIGELQWAKNIGGPNGENGTAITADAAGNVYVTGVFQDEMDFDPGVGEFLMTPAGFLDTFILKLDANGNFVWAKSIAGVDYEQANGIGTDGAGNVYLAGFFFATADFDPGVAEFNMTPIGFHDCFALKLNSSGEFVWAKQWGSTNFDFVTGLKVTEAGNMHVIGTFSGDMDVNPDPAGEFILSLPTNYDGCFLVQLDTNGTFVEGVKVGHSNFRIFGFGLDIDNQGARLLSGYYGGIAEFLMADGSTTSITASDFFNSYVVKILANGQIAWVKGIDATAGSEAFGLVTNSQNEVFIGGFFDGTLNSGTLSLIQQNTQNAQESYMLKLDSNGNTMAAYQFGGADFIDGFPIGIDQNDNVYLSTAFQHTVDINPMPNAVFEITSVNHRDNFLIKMDNTVLSNPVFEHHAFTIYPNPVQEWVTINADTTFVGTAYTITDMTGRIVLSGKLDHNQTIHLAAVPAGSYIITLGQHSKKLIKI